MKSRCFAILVIFFLFLISGYVVAGYTRHLIHEGVIEKHVTRMVTLQEEGIQKPMGWEDHEYLGTPEAALVVADPVFQEEIYSLYEIWLDYMIEYEIEVLFSLLAEIDDDIWSLWDAYRNQMIFEYQRKTFWVAGNLIFLRPGNESDWGGSLAESVALWEAAGGKREGNWMGDYKQSPEYKIWLNQIFEEIAEPKEMKTEDYNPTCKEDQYQETTRQVELPFFDNLLWKDMLETERRMTEIAYERYLIHVSEKDFVRANMDSWIVEFTGYDFHSATSNGFELPNTLTPFSPLRDFVIDICVISAFSIVLTFLVAKRILPRFEPNTRPKRE